MPGETPLQTPLFAWHKAHGGRIVDFGGWAMPVQYSTIIDEHQAVRRRVGLFDIGHMGRLRFEGPAALAWLERATTNHVGKLAVGQIQYSLLVDERGEILDDILVYRQPDAFLVVCNASNRPKVVAHLAAIGAGLDATLDDQTTRTAMIAVQGPSALALAGRILRGPIGDLRYYTSCTAEDGEEPVLVSRTGYTGEDGFELIVPAGAAESVWSRLIEAGADLGVLPCGLGARDTLRFEAAMPLYGHEMDETVDPYEAGLGWAVKLNKGDFVGRDALATRKAAPARTRIGLRLEGKRIARQGAAVLLDGRPVGAVTSGTFSPTLEQTLAMALVDRGASAIGTPLVVDVRGNPAGAAVVPLPFYRRPAETAGPSVG